MTPRSVFEISLSSGGKESFGEAMQEIAAGPDAAPGMQTGPAEAASPAVTEEKKALLFNRYRTERELGRGGMGIVWLAHDTVLDIPVALKLVPDAIVHDTEGIVNLKKEVLRGMALAHPGIVRVHGFEQQEKTAGIVMEYVDGMSFAEKKTRQRAMSFSVEEVRPWLEQLCAALDYAHHDARIAHRDLKPGNLLVTSAGRVKIVDFGLAATLSETRSRVSSRLGISGTPPYMSPQQLMGHRPTHLDDLYSLGATIFELLAGTPPFFRGDIVAQVLHETPVSLAARREEFGIENGPIPPGWERAIAACLSKDPEARPANGAAILRMLDEEESAAPLRGKLEDNKVNLPAKDGASYRPITSKAGSAGANSVTELHLPAARGPQSEPRLALVPFARAELQAASSSVPQETVQQVHVRPAAARQTRAITLQPVVGAFAWLIRGIAVMITGLADLVMSILRPLLKIAAGIAVLWGLLHLKQKWDAGAPERQAAAAAAQRQVPLPPGGAPQGRAFQAPPPPPPPPPPPRGPQGGNPLDPPPRPPRR